MCATLSKCTTNFLGPQGPQGANGSIGDTGAPGVPGSPGPQGSISDQGTYLSMYIAQYYVILINFDKRAIFFICKVVGMLYGK